MTSAPRPGVSRTHTKQLRRRGRSPGGSRFHDVTVRGSGDHRLGLSWHISTRWTACWIATADARSSAAVPVISATPAAAARPSEAGTEIPCAGLRRGLLRPHGPGSASMAVKWLHVRKSLLVPCPAGPLPGMQWVLSCAWGSARPSPGPMEVGSEGQGKDHRRSDDQRCRSGRPVGPPLSRRAERAHEGRDHFEPSGKVRSGGAGRTADPGDVAMVASPATTPATSRGHDAALLTLVGWSMRRPQMTPSIVIPSRGRRTTRIVPVTVDAEG